jgi:hypothetical protein
MREARVEARVEVGVSYLHFTVNERQKDKLRIAPGRSLTAEQEIRPNDVANCFSAVRRHTNFTVLFIRHSIILRTELTKGDAVERTRYTPRELLESFSKAAFEKLAFKM